MLAALSLHCSYEPLARVTRKVPGSLEALGSRDGRIHLLTEHCYHSRYGTILASRVLHPTPLSKPDPITPMARRSQG